MSLGPEQQEVGFHSFKDDNGNLLDGASAEGWSNHASTVMDEIKGTR